MLNLFLIAILFWVICYVLVFIEDKLSDFYFFVKHKILKRPKVVSVSIDEVINRKRNLFEKVYYPFVRFINKVYSFPSDFYYESKYFIQRGVRGFSDRDTWSIDYYLCTIVPPMLEKLKAGHGYPIVITSKKYFDEYGCLTEEGRKINYEKWKNILDKIISAFKIHSEINDNFWFYQKSNKYSFEKVEKMLELRKSLSKDSPMYGHVMTKEECKFLEEGQKLFWEYFQNFWD